MNRWKQIATAGVASWLILGALGCHSSTPSEPGPGASSVTGSPNAGGKPVSAPLPPGATGTNADTFVNQGGK